MTAGGLVITTEHIESWRQGVLDLVQDLAVVEGSLVGLDGDQVDKAQSLRWIERTRARLEQLAERMSAQPITPEEARPQ